MARASEISIVAGFATPGGLSAISAPIMTRPKVLRAFIVGAATYPGFQAMDELLAGGVPADRLHVHLGHTSATGGHKNPFARYHPMLHSKVYYMELPGGQACAFIGSHNMTSFALTGLNGEAAVMLEGRADSPEFEKVRQHIAAARAQAVQYAPEMKEGFAWWTSEFIDGMKAEMKIPRDWTTVRTILLFASAATTDRPKTGENLYFEIPAGIEQIESLKTETHLFLFDVLPATPREALDRAFMSAARYTCTTLGAENKQGNREIAAQWRIDGATGSILLPVPGAIYRPSPPAGMQQVRAEIVKSDVIVSDYAFERESAAWNPAFASSDASLRMPALQIADTARFEANGGSRTAREWKLVKGLERRSGSPREKDESALRLVSPDSGSFILVSLRRRSRNKAEYSKLSD